MTRSLLTCSHQPRLSPRNPFASWFQGLKRTEHLFLTQWFQTHWRKQLETSNWFCILLWKEQESWTSIQTHFSLEQYFWDHWGYLRGARYSHRGASQPYSLGHRHSTVGQPYLRCRIQWCRLQILWISLLIGWGFWTHWSSLISDCLRAVRRHQRHLQSRLVSGLWAGCIGNWSSLFQQRLLSLGLLGCHKW